MKHLALIVVIFAVAYFTLKGFFAFAMSGDDILAIHRYLSGTTWRSLFSPYGGQNIAAGIAYNVIGLNSHSQLVLVFVLRVCVSICVYTLGYTYTKRKDYSFFVALLSIVGFAGIVTAEYTVLLGLYIGLIFLLIGLIMLVRYYQYSARAVNFKSMWKFALVSFILSLSIAVATVRVNGILLLLPLLEIGLLIFRKSNLKASLIRLIIISIFIFVLKQLGSFGGDSPYHLAVIQENTAMIFANSKTLLRSAFYFVVIYYDILIPPVIDGLLQNILYHLRFIEYINSGVYIPLFALGYYFIVKRFNTTKIYIFALLVAWVTYLVLFYWSFGDLYKNTVTASFSTTHTDYLFQAMNSLFGGLFVFSVFAYISSIFVDKRYSIAANSLMLFLTPLLFMGATYFFSPRTFYFETFTNYIIPTQESNVHYYYIPAIGLYYSICYLLLISKRQRLKRYIVVLSLLAITNIISVRGFISSRLPYRSSTLVDQVVLTINSELSHSFAKKTRPLVFFLEIDDNQYFFPYAVNEWGFAPYKYSLINNELSIVPLFFANSQKEAVEQLMSEDFYRKYSISTPFPKEDVYAYTVKDQVVISQTQKFRTGIQDIVTPFLK